MSNGKLPPHRAGLPGKVISFYVVPLDSAYKAGLAGHVPVKARSSNEIQSSNYEI
jgi:hypothetical protein